MNDGPVSSITEARARYHPGVALFAQAVAASQRAAQAHTAADTGDRHYDPNPRAREIDACVLTIVLADAALECAWNWEGLPSNKWPWRTAEGLVAAARRAGRSAPSLPDETRTELALMRTWRNFFHHGSDSARRQLGTQLGRSDWEDLRNLTAEYAGQVVTLMERIAAAIAEATGGIALGPANAVWTGEPSADTAP